MQFSERSKILIAFASLVLIAWIVAPVHAQESKKIVGSVVDPNSAPVPAAQITLYSLERILQTTSDSSGHFHFDGVLPTNYEIEVLAPGFRRFSKIVDLTDNKPIVMEIAAPVSPVVVDSVLEVAPTGTCGLPYSVVYDLRKSADAAVLSGIAIEQYATRRLSAVKVQLFDAMGVQIAQQETNEDGEFQFRKVSPGRYYVVSARPGYDNLKSREFWVTRENATRLTLRPVPAGKIMVCQ